MRPFQILRNISKLNSNSQQQNYIEPLLHIPVLAKEILELFQPNDGQCYLDMTFGGGGHTRHLLSSNKKITIFTLDRDRQAFERAVSLSKRISEQNSGQKIIPLLGRFSNLDRLLNNMKIPLEIFDGAIMDLGASSYQYENGERGFSIKLDGPLDMRMDGDINPNQPTAADVINTLNAEELAKIFKYYGEEKNALKIAQVIVDSRFMMKRLNTTGELAQLVESVYSKKNSPQDKLGRKAHPATKVFQALRIFVNNELNELNYAIEIIRKYLKKESQSPQKLDDNEMISKQKNDGGLLAIISFHSLEDKIVKNHFTHRNLISPPKSNHYTMTTNHFDDTDDSNKLMEEKFWKFFKQKFFVPQEEEIVQNPRSRSAKMRVGLRIR